MSLVKMRKLKAYNYSTFGQARARGYSKIQYERSVKAKQTWDNLPELKKDYILSNLSKGRRKYLREVKRMEIEENNLNGTIEAYEVVLSTHYDARLKKGGKSRMEYNLTGYFTNEPTPTKIEKMAENTLIRLFNQNASVKRYLTNKPFSSLTDIRGVQIKKVLVAGYKINNALKGEFSINNKGNKWVQKD